MIKSFNHKRLKDFFFTDSKKGIIPNQASKLARILDRLDASLFAADMDLPGFKLHKLTGKEKEIWSVNVNGNWRVTFYLKEGDAYIVDYRDYH
ncbi:MAG: type II toxin-antitoxin system RelE/ParE family toxin [Spirochaetia bacterium]|jgi:proteic killer suppression protein|nr:type II toxin-antitoxin system RelE/ParE family toxin [Spirochaetia bacterium]